MTKVFHVFLHRKPLFFHQFDVGRSTHYLSNIYPKLNPDCSVPSEQVLKAMKIAHHTDIVFKGSFSADDIISKHLGKTSLVYSHMTLNDEFIVRGKSGCKSCKEMENVFFLSPFSHKISHRLFSILVNVRKMKMILSNLLCLLQFATIS